MEERRMNHLAGKKHAVIAGPAGMSIVNAQLLVMNPE